MATAAPVSQCLGRGCAFSLKKGTSDNHPCVHQHATFSQRQYPLGLAAPEEYHWPPEAVQSLAKAEQLSVPELGVQLQRPVQDC